MIEKSLCAVLLVAGSSKRFGEDNKLLAKIDGIPICVHALQSLINSSVTSIIVVTGHQQADVTIALRQYIDLDIDRIQIVHNSSYKKGMGSTLSAGLLYAQNFDAAMIFLGDMPFVDTGTIVSLINAWRDDDQHLAVAPEYKKRLGNPVILNHLLFKKLMSLSEDFGARAWLKDNASAVLEVPVTSDAIFRDIDIASDLAPR